MEKSLILKNSSETPIPTYPKKEKRTKVFKTKLLRTRLIKLKPPC
jgi:hypothetical protein